MDRLKFDMHFNAKDIWMFSMYHGNRGFMLIFNVFFTISMYGYIIYSRLNLDMPRKIMVLILANMFLIIQPLLLYLKSLRQAKSDAIKNGLSVELNDRGIVVSSNGESAEFLWGNGFRSKILPGLIIIYVDTIRAYLLPDRYIDKVKPEVIKILKEKTRIIKF